MNWCRLEFSFRYAVVGVYLDRERNIVRIYPLPFVRLSLGNLEES